MNNPAGTVLYDDSCGFCRTWVPWWKRTLMRHGFDIAPLQSDWASERLRLPPEELQRDLRLVLRDGGQIQGADVYRYVTRRIWWALPLYWFSVAPGFRRVFDWAYRSFANNRYRFSSACRLPGAGEREE